MRIGILGGSFDPIHFGHLGVARAVADALGLDKVLLVPAARAPLRPAGVAASGVERAEMARIAVAALAAQAGERRLVVDETELRRGGVSYTVDTLRAFRAASPEDEFTWIVGADQLARLPQWREPTELARLADWAAYARPGHGWATLPESSLSGFQVRRVEADNGALWDISSSEIRARLARGESVTGMLPDKVIEYIYEKGLYRAQ